jgi:hypothetical protein
MADAVLEDKVQHAHPIGTIEMTCPRCAKSVAMSCYRIPSGPFGTHKGLHLLCPSCSGIWSVDRDDEARILAAIAPVVSGS